MAPFKNIPLEQCKKECNDREACKSMDYGRTSHDCYLGDIATPSSCPSDDLYIKVTDCHEKNAKNKEFYDQGKLWGSWTVKGDKKAFGGQPIVIKDDATWSIKGAISNGKVEWDGESIIDLYYEKSSDKESHFLRFIDENTVEVVKQEGGQVWTLVRGEAEAEEAKDTSSKDTSSKDTSSSSDGKYAIIELGATFKMQSSWNADWAKPRLDSSTGFHNSKEASEEKKDFWIEIEMKKPSEVHQVILSKINFGKDRDDLRNRIYSGIKIEYQVGSDWISYKNGKVVRTGQMERDDSDAKLMIDVVPFIASNVRITIPSDTLPPNDANAKHYIGGRVDLRVTEK